MHKGKYVFSQLLDFLERNDFNYLARKYGGDKYVKHFTRYNQLYVLTFGQLSNRDYRIFEEFAYKVIAEAQRCRIVDIFKLNGNIYAFELALFRKKKRGIKMHTLYNLETQIPTFFHITPAKVHDTKAMDAIPYEENSFYIFDRGYNNFKPMKWKCRFPTGSGIQSDAVGYMAGQLTMEKYPDKIRRVIYLDKDSKKKFIFFTNAMTINPVMVGNPIITDG